MSAQDKRAYGLNHWAAFYGSNANAGIAGDVAMLAPSAVVGLLCSSR